MYSRVPSAITSYILGLIQWFPTQRYRHGRHFCNFGLWPNLTTSYIIITPPSTRNDPYTQIYRGRGPLETNPRITQLGTTGPTKPVVTQ